MTFDLKPEEINYVKIVYKDGKGFLHIAKTAVKRIDTKEIYVSARIDEDAFVPSPQDVDTGYVTESGLYKAVTELKYVIKDDEYINFALKIPDSLEYRQSREYFRVRLQCPVVISYTENDSAQRIECQSHDISANGLCVVLPNEIKFSKDVQLEIDLDIKTIKTQAKYIRIDNEDGILRASFNFENLLERDLDCISQVCIQKQLENRRNMLFD